jgi:diguanylate cyclase (GGDEF)-like protein
MQRRIDELSLLAEFNAAIGTLLDPDQVCATACSWLEEVVRWEVLAVSCAERESQQYRYQVLYLDDHLSEICPELAEGVSPATVRTEKRKIAWSDSGNNVISVCFPDRSGILALSRKSVQESQFSDELVTGIADSLSRSLSNARECARLKTLSMRDHLTGLYNRRVFEAMLEVEARKRTAKPFSLMLIDLDNFKAINDTYGHGAGDEVLVNVADLLRQNFRKADVPARYGGDEFCVLLPETSLDAALRVAERFRGSVAASPPVFENREILPTVSVGIAVVSNRASIEVADVVEEADRALYRAKAPGKNRVCAALVNSHGG